MIRQICRFLPQTTQQFLRQLVGSVKQTQGFSRGRRLANTPSPIEAAREASGNNPFQERSNSLRNYFDSHREGPGIWKWTHYFEIYHRHLQKFIGRDINVLEIGIYSGGSLSMWTNYFGANCQLYGVDIEPACRAYENNSVKVYIGDQADRSFWRRFRSEVPPLDVVIDDGGHRPHQQIVTLEETLSHLKPGGVYICEDVHSAGNAFLQYINGFATNLYTFTSTPPEPGNPERQHVVSATPFQSAIHSLHLYPYVVVIEKNIAPVAEFSAPKHGTEWQPFLGGAPGTPK